MYNKKKVAKKYLLIVIIIIFLLGFIYLDKKRTNYLFFEKIIKNTVSQVENFLIPKVKVDYSNIVSGINRELEDENNELKKMLLLDSTDYQFIHADVIERNDLWYREIKINKGSNDGIKTNMAVIANDGLIGKIIKVSNSFSIVKLLCANDSDMKIAVDIRSDDNIYHGILSGYDISSQTVSVINVSKDSDISINDLVYTNGLGGVYPSEIYIGKVVDISYDSLGIEKNIKVKSDASFDKLRYVSVVDRNMQ